MGSLYENINALCVENGIKPSKLCAETGLSRGLITDLKMGRKKSVSAETAQKIANYFGVTVGYLLGEEETKNAPVAEDKRITDDDIKFALFKGDGEITDAMLEEVKAFAAFVQQREKNKEKK